MIRLSANRGFIGSTKFGAKVSNSPYILFLNSDTEAIEKNWLDKLIPKDKNVAIVGTKLLFPPTHPKLLANKVQHAGVAVFERPNNNYNIFHIYSGYDLNFLEVCHYKSLNTVTGACFLIRRDVWNRLGGWDVNFNKGVYEDVDLCWRVNERGYDILYDPSTCLYHHESAGTKDKREHPLQKFGGENFQYLLRKWHNRVPVNGNSFYGKGTNERWKEYASKIVEAIPYLDKKDFDEAREIGMQCINVAPEFHGGYYIVGVCLSKAGYHKESIEFLQESLRTNPVFWQSRFQLIEEFMETERISDANQEFNLVAEVFPDHQKVRELYNSLTKKQLLT